jgi:hypothetical protein
MQGQLPEHLIRSEADVYSILPSHITLAEDTHTPRPMDEEKELCIICMAEYAVVLGIGSHCVGYCPSSLWPCSIIQNPSDE